MTNSYLSARTMIEELVRNGVTKREISRRTGICYQTLLRIAARPYTYVPLGDISSRLAELYRTRLAELEADAAFRAFSDLEG